MLWTKSHRCDPFGRDIADRHYNRQSIGAANFVPPGRCLVLTANTETGKALWVTSWPYAEYVKHAWAGAWVCSLFRNENAALASLLIKEAVAKTKEYYGDPPPLGMITFIDETKVKSIKRRGVSYIGYTYELAGFEFVGYTKSGLVAMQLKADKI